MIEAILIGGVIAFGIVFWWAMIEAQDDISGVNEPKTRGKYHTKKGRK